MREIEQSQKQQQKTNGPQTGNRRPKAATPRVNPNKLSVLSDGNAQASSSSKGSHEEDIEYAPPPVAPRPYESDVFPEGVLTFAAFQPQNRLRGVYDHYYNPVDETDGVPLREKAFAEKQRRAFEKLDILVQEDMDSFDWSIGDVPASKDLFAKRKQETKTPAPAPPPATIASRKAASALGISSKTNKPLGTNTALKTKTAAANVNASSASSISSSLLSALPLRKPKTTASALPLRPKSTNVHRPVAETASRTTLGYNKGRTALSMVRSNGAPAPRAPTPSTLRPKSQTSTVRRVGPATAAPETDNVAATPAPRTHQKQTSLGDLFNDDLEGPSTPKSPAFLSIFDVQEDENDNLGGAGTFVNEDLDDEFQMDIKF